MSRSNSPAPRLLVAAVPLALALACGSGPENRTAPSSEAARGQESSELAAEVNGVPITVAELDAWIKEQLFASRASSPAKLYELRDRYLDALVQEQILEIEAERRGTTPEALIEEEVEALGPVRDDEIAAFYEKNREQLGGATLQQMGGRIREFLGARRSQQAAESLRESAEVVVHLEAPRFDVAAEGPSQGPESAPVTIVEFSDFQCPYCRRAISTVKKVLEKYPDQVRVVYRQFPLTSHSRARPAAEASLCAHEQGKFWPYHDLLFENARQLTDEALVGYAEEIGLDRARFEQCFEQQKFADQVDRDLQAGREVGVTGTPAFLVNGVLISGAKPPADFYRVIDAELERLGKKQSS